MTDDQNVEVGGDDVRQRAGHDLLHRHAIKPVQDPLRLLGSLLLLGSLPLLRRLLRPITLCGSASLLLRWCHVYVRKTKGGEQTLEPWPYSKSD